MQLPVTRTSLRRAALAGSVSVLASAGLVLGAAGVGAQETEHCVQAHRHLEEVADMAAITDPDTIDDWRTGRMVPGCRVTAAGVTSLPPEELIREFYDGLRSAGWERTPDPADAPNEASLRFRKDGADCLFNYYTDGMLFTESEEEVDNAVIPVPGQSRYNFLVMCMPAMPAG